MMNNSIYSHPMPKPSCSSRFQIREEENGADQKPHNDMHGLVTSSNDFHTMPPLHRIGLECPPSPDFYNQSFPASHRQKPVSAAQSNWPLDEDNGFSASHVQGQLPFTPECPLELEVFQQWKSNHPAYQQPSVEVAGGSHDLADWMINTNAAGEPMSMTDSGVDLSVPPKYHDANHECSSSPSVSPEVCSNPDKCELSPDMAEAMQRFGVPHICEYEQAKRLLVEKIVNKVLQNAAPRIMALLEEELRKREDDMDDVEEDLDDEDMDSEFEAKL
ncbi:hypothetical protein QBC32DRAFT_36068 [Pseudoneurospora amorphoporcata]|uniref:Uncharacterized protein n=1 Tax=Pseudoneurospora amorphoporcata TaxID=241081 RepID=A0AAN6SDS6_9PEZI|nr:hypothetical protein QBC32DRAFT_36068 [Pseudoneurospora amorphoporcata]